MNVLLYRYSLAIPVANSGAAAYQNKRTEISKTYPTTTSLCSTRMALPNRMAAIYWLAEDSNPELSRYLLRSPKVRILERV